MSIGDDFSMYWSVYLLALACGLLGSVAATSGLWRLCRSLRLRVVDLENAAVQVRNRQYANKRWSNQEQLEAELSSMMASGKAPKTQQRYANDPPEF